MFKFQGTLGLNSFFSASISFAPSVIVALNQSLRGGGYKTEVRPSLRFLINNPFPKNLGRNSQVSLICEHYMIPMRKKVNHTLRWWWHLKRSNFDLFKCFEIFIHASLI